jgi:nucleoside-diphosphate-sugar epimerase
MAEVLHAQAAALWRGSLGASDRVLVLGATGWFGRTATALLQQALSASLLVASRARSFDIADKPATCSAWDWDEVQAFAPTVIVDCAFLTRDLVSQMTLSEYVSRNRALTDRMLAASGIHSVQRVITISSGAAVYPVDALSQPLADNPYGRLKREAEQQLTELGLSRGIRTVIARAWSVSGAFVQKPRSYALSDMILQARTGTIEIAATTPVFRRYTGVDDLLALALAHAVEGGRSVIDSGGQLVEMMGLAEAVVAAVNPAATINRAEVAGGEPNTYHSDDLSWQGACAEIAFAPATLRQQIDIANAGLAAETSATG